MSSLVDLFAQLFDTSDFPARWHCGRWSSAHGWTHIVADLATFSAYFAIPVVILVYRRRRPDVQFPALFLLFAAFILSCGTVHLIEASIFWTPVYRLSALAKVVTAVVSLATVVALIRVFPQAMKLPGLAAMNAQLVCENEQRRAVEAELRARNEDLDEFAYVASHDLKAPLRSIGSLAEWIEEDSGGELSESSRRYMEKLKGRVERMQGLLDSLLLYSRVGKQSGGGEAVDVGALVREACDLLGLPPEARVDVGELPDVVAARAPLELVLRNLISNAIKHHDCADPMLTVRGFVDGEQCVYRVTDDGPGIPEADRERVFALFQTLKPRDEVEGSGMGLAIAAKAARSLNGTLELLPGEGRGATFELRVPRRPQACDLEAECAVDELLCKRRGGEAHAVDPREVGAS